MVGCTVRVAMVLQRVSAAAIEQRSGILLAIEPRNGATTAEMHRCECTDAYGRSGARTCEHLWSPENELAT
jgi:hypothetical protein